MNTETEATEISASSARQNFSKIIDAVRVAGERVLLTRHGRPAASVIGVKTWSCCNFSRIVWM